MTIKVLSIVLAIGCLTSFAFGQSATAEVHLKLTPVDDKQTYRIGEPIKLLLELTADRDGYQMNTVPYTSESVADTISVSPETGVLHWRKDYFGLGSECVVSYAKLSNAPQRIEFVLNDSIAFNKPGRYAISVTTRRVSTGPSPDLQHFVVTSNDLNLVIESMSDTDERKKVEGLSSIIDSTNDPRTTAAACTQLNFLTGDQSSREKVRRLIGAEARPCVDTYTGLFNARNRALVLQLLESEFRDETTPATSVLLGALTKLRLLAERAGAPAQPFDLSGFTGVVDQRTSEIEGAYVAELAAGLSKRTGKSQTSAAMTILAHLPKEAQARVAMLSEVRPILLRNFDRLASYEQDYLLNQYWEQLRDPSLVPSIKKILGNTAIASSYMHGAALKRLLEVSPDEARPFIIAEIRDPNSFVDREILGSLPDPTLPEVDSVLLEQIRQFASSPAGSNRVRLQYRTALAARFASKGIYANLMDIYRQAGEKMPPEALPGFIAYFARHDEAEGLALLERTLDQSLDRQSTLLSDFARLYFSEAVDTLLRKRLESDEQEIASTAAYLISLHGPADDLKVIEQRLQRWQRDWGSRIADADSNFQGRIETELIMALTRGKSWKQPPEKVKELQRGCVTKICKQTFHLQ